MKLLKNLTTKIHLTHTSNLAIRAKYLYELFLPLAGPLPGKNDYLDIGCGLGVNSRVFGRDFKHINCLDFYALNLMRCKDNVEIQKDVSFIAADAQSLPFKTEHFDFVTAFSLIEHVPSQEKMLNEAFRVLRPGGELVIQFPNRYFFMELHSGIPFCFLIPNLARPLASKILGYEGLSEIKLPTPRRIRKMITKMNIPCDVKVVKVIYPDSTIPEGFRKFYSILNKCGIFRIIPFGWMLVCKKLTPP